MKKFYLVLPLFLFILGAVSAQNFFQPIAESDMALPATAKPSIWSPLVYSTFQTDVAGLSAVIAAAPMEQTTAARQGKTVISVPQPDGTFEDFAVWRIMTCEPAVYERHPEIRTFSGYSLRDARKTLRGTITLRGLSIMQMLPDFGLIYVEPIADGQTTYYRVYDRKDIPQNLVPQGLTRGVAPGAAGSAPPVTTLPTASVEERGTLIEQVKYKVFRYIVSCTGEFTVDNGGTKELSFAAAVQYSNEVSAFFERDIALRLQMLAASEAVIYTDPLTDPFTGTSVGQWMGQNVLVVNTAVGTNNYDVGHVYGRYMGGDAIGVAAGIGTVCLDNKGAGCSAGYQGIYGDNFRNTIGQEIGHQLGGGHSWNRCNGGTGRTGLSAFEPGSGSTIMSYGGSCGADNVQGASDLYFHSGSIEEIQFNYTFAAGNLCGTYEDKSNNRPEVTLPYTNDFFIPILTPFELYGSATDPDGDSTLTYSWEEMDLGPEIPLGTQEDDSPLFRTRPAVANNNRVFPRLPIILANTTDKTELLPDHERNMNFRMTVRDNRVDEGGVAWKDVSFRTVGTSGPFLVSYPNLATASWSIGSYVTVLWDVANTNIAPVNCKKVNIRLSTDGGLTWPTVLASNVGNDGNQIVQVPDIASTKARIRIDAADNIFFDVSNANFKIVAPTQAALTAGLSENSATICLPNSFTANVLTTGVLGYDKPVALDLVGTLPPNATASLSVTNIATGQSSVLSVDLSNVVVAGVYTFNVRVISDNDTTLLPVTLSTTTNDFSAQALQLPADGSLGLTQSQILRWSKGVDALSYDLQLATSPSFAANTIVASKTYTEVDSFKIPFLLDKSQAYFWRIRPNNSCSPHLWSEPFFFSTLTENCSTFSANDLPKNVSANNVNTVETKIEIGQGVVLSDINVKALKGYHDYFGDLDVRLVSPAGTEVILFKNRCNNFSGPFNFGLDDSSPNAFSCPPSNGGNFVKPQGLLSPLIGQNSTGVWTLKVKDTQPTSGGTIEDFQLDFCAGVSLNPPYLVKNNVLSIETGTNKVIGNDLLLVEDANNTHAQLVFTLLTTLPNGRLEKNWGGALNPGDQFTQEDLDNGLIRYFDYGFDLSEVCFRFVVTDGEGGFLGTLSYCIQPYTTSVQTPGDATLRFEVYPNPATDILSIALTQPATDDMRIQLFDLAGRVVSTVVLPAGQIRSTLSVANLPHGVYIAQVRGDRAMGVRKVVVGE